MHSAVYAVAVPVRPPSVYLFGRRASFRMSKIFMKLQWDYQRRQNTWPTKNLRHST